MENLPDDIISDIISRVPVESILDCKLVSKPWRDLIRHQSFGQTHLNRFNDLDSSGKSGFIFSSFSTEEPCYYTEYDEDLKCFSRTARINFKLPFKHFQLVGSSNGLICFSGYFHNIYLQPTFVCNPITREYILLPDLEEKDYMCGFGYSSSTNEYKVVRICEYEEDPMIEVYTLGSGRWRNVRKLGYYRPKRLQQDADKFFDGALHWLGHQGTIVAFDLSNEELRELPPLPLPGDPRPLARPDVLGGFLCAYHGGFSHGDRVREIWVLKKNMIWTKVLKFNNLGICSITLTKNRELLALRHRDNNVYHYSSSSRKHVQFGKKFCDSIAHRNTFVSLKALGEEDTKLMEPADLREEKQEDQVGAAVPMKQEKEQGEKQSDGLYKENSKQKEDKGDKQSDGMHKENLDQKGDQGAKQSDVLQKEEHGDKQGDGLQKVN